MTQGGVAQSEFRALFESVPGLYVVLEADAPRYTIVAVSDAYARHTLTKRDEMLGKGFAEVFRDDSDESCTPGVRDTLDSLARVLATGAPDRVPPQRHDIRVPPTQGGGLEERWCSQVNSPVIDPGGKVTHIVHGVEDVTELIRLGRTSRDELRIQQQRLRELFDSAPDGIFIAGPDGRYTDVNPAGCRLLGYSREELVGRSIVEFVAPEELARQAALKRHVLEGGSEVSQWRLRRKDGTYVLAELSTNARPDGHLQAFVRDLTERHEAEEAARLSEAKCSGIIAVSADAIISIDDRQRITLFNDGAEKIFGYSRAEAIGAPLELLLPERFRATHHRHVERFAADAAPARPMGERRSTIAGRRKNGEEFPAEAAISKIEVGGRRLLTVSIRDVTETRRIEDALRSSVARFEVALKGANAVVTEQDEHLRTTWFYSSLAPTGTTAEVLGKTDSDFLPPAEAAKIEALERGVLETGEPTRQILQVTSSGTTRWYDMTIQPRRDSNGRIVGVVSAAWDVSAQKRVENEERLLAETGKILVSAGADYKSLLSDVANVIVRHVADWCSVDILQDDEIHRLRVVCSDPAKAAVCEALEGYQARRYSAIADVLATQRPIVMSEVTPAYLEAAAQSAEHLELLRALDPTSFIVAPLIARGHSLGTIVFGGSGASRRFGPQDVRLVEEVAARVALAVDNARLHANLERAVRARDEVLGIVAHDLRNPLNAISLAAQVLDRQVSEEGVQRGGKSLERIRRASRRAKHLIDDLLDVTQIDAGKLSVVRDHFAAHQLVVDAVEGQQLLASAAALELSLDVDPLLPEVWADRDRCLQVLENLIGNAIKFTRGGGSITVAAALGDGDVRFSVADSGPGIAADSLPHVFDRFWRADRTARRGAGLGLQICKGIIDAHGGRIWVESTPGRGTTFHFTLPIWRPVLDPPLHESGTRELAMTEEP